MFENESIKWTKAFCEVKRANTPYGLAPHKPIFLLTLLDAFDKGLIRENKILLSPQLLSLFFGNWEILVKSKNIADITQPFFHLQSDRLDDQQWWFVRTKSGYLKTVIKSFKRLSEETEYATLHPELYFCLTDSKHRKNLRLALLNHFFNMADIETINLENDKSRFWRELEKQVLNESGPPITRVKVQKEQEEYVRSRIFQKAIPEAYNFVCAFSGMSTRSTSGLYLIEACHIKPFKRTLDDSISNGICLCPNMHTAFDKGLISVDEEERIIVSKHVVEIVENPYSLKNLEGNKIRKPIKENYRPSPANFEYHRDHIFLK